MVATLAACTAGPTPPAAGSAGTPTSDTRSGVAASPSPAAGPTQSPTGPVSSPSSTGQGGTTSLPPFRIDTGPDERDPGRTGEVSVVVDVRAARQDGYDRVVFEFGRPGGGGAAPGWFVSYTDDPRRQGSGDPVELEGGAALLVVIRGVGYDTQIPGAQEFAGDPMLPEDMEVVRQVDFGSTFEGDTEALLGLDQRRAFRVFRLADPNRVIVDIRHR